MRAPFMHQTEQLGYGEGRDFKAADLPYRGSQVSMLVVLPSDLDEFEAGLDAARLEEVIATVRPSTLRLSLPKFEFRSRLQLADPLQALGMQAAFDPDLANFSGMDGGRDLVIDKVIQESFVKVDEAGTEAAAATAVAMLRATGMLLEVPQLDVDRPFLFLIRDRVTGAVLFMGRVVDPTR